MIRPAALAVACTVVTAVPFHRHQQPQRPTFRAAVAGVTVDVSVRRDRVPVGGLTRDDFELFDNGVRQQIDSVAIEAVPIDVSLAVDTSGSVVPNLDAFREEVRRFARMLRPVDRLRIVTFGTSVLEVLPMAPVPARLNLDAIGPGGATSSNDGLFYALLWPAAIDRRHLVIALTDGVDTYSTIHSASVTAVATRVNAVFHVVLVDGIGYGTTWEKGSREAVIEAAKQSGGEVHSLGRASSDFKQIFDDFRASYVLRFTPEGVSQTGWHDLTVKLAKLDPAQHTVRARRGYWGATR